MNSPVYGPIHQWPKRKRLVRVFQAQQWATFRSIDRWIRGRLRTMLRKRNRKRGRAKSRDDFKHWPNAYFAEQGLFSLENSRCASASILEEVNHQPESRCGETACSVRREGGAENNRLCNSTVTASSLAERHRPRRALVPAK